MFEVGRQIEFFMQLGGPRPLGSNDNKKGGHRALWAGKTDFLELK